MAIISESSFLPAASFSTIGELRLKQVNPIAHKGVDESFNSALISQGSLNPEDYELSSLFKDYSSRNCKFSVI